MDLFDLAIKISIDADEAMNGISNFSGKMKSAFGTAAKVGAAAIGAASAAVTAFGKSSIEAGISFDSAMSKVAAISGAAGENFDALRDKAREMGSQTKFSATESAEALTYMAMAGWKTEDMLNGIEGIMNLAASSGENLASTSDIVTDALTAFGLAAQDSGHFADVLAAASSNANTNVSMLGESFKYVAPVAGAMKYSVEDTSIALGLMANSGIKASQAGTALRTLLTNMAKPTDNMAAAMEQVGISLQNSEGEMYSFMEIMQQLRNGFSDLKMSEEEYLSGISNLEEELKSGKITEEKFNEAQKILFENAYGSEKAMKAETAAMLAGKEGMSGLLAIINASEEDFAKLTGSIYSASGVMVKTADGSIIPMNDALESGVEIIEKYNGAAESMATVMENNLEGDIKKAQSALGELQITLSDQLTPSFQEFVKFGSSGVSRITEAFKEKGLSGALDEFGDVLSEGLEKINKNIPDFTDTAVHLLSEIGGAIVDNVPVLFNSLTQLVDKSVDFIVKNGPTLIESAVKILVDMATALTDPKNLDHMLDSALSIVQSLADGIIKAIPVLIECLHQIITNIVEFLLGAIPKITETGFDLLVSLVADLPKIIFSINAAIPKIVSGLIGAVTSSIPKFVEIGFKFFTSLIKRLPEMIDNIVQGTKNVLESIISTVVGFFSKMFSIGFDLFSSLADGIGNSISIISSVVNEVGETIKNIFSGIISSALTWGKDLIDNFVGGIKNSVGKVGDAVKGVGDKIKGLIGFSEPEDPESPLHNFHTFAPDMMELFAKGVRDNTHLITDQIEKSFDFGSNMIPETIANRAGGTQVNTFASNNSEQTIKVDFVLRMDDGTVLQTLSRRLYPFMQNESVVRGNSMVNGGAFA